MICAATIGDITSYCQAGEMIHMAVLLSLAHLLNTDTQRMSMKTQHHIPIKKVSIGLFNFLYFLYKTDQEHICTYT